MDNAYRCMRTLIVTDELITKTKDHICKTMLLWRQLKIPVTPFLESHLETVADFLIRHENRIIIINYSNYFARKLIHQLIHYQFLIFIISIGIICMKMNIYTLFLPLIVVNKTFSKFTKDINFFPKFK